MATIRVEQAVRDRLAALDDLQWQAIEAGYRRLATKPDELRAYQVEAETFSAADLGELADTAAEEYPEYNCGRP